MIHKTFQTGTESRIISCWEEEDGAVVISQESFGDLTRATYDSDV